MGPGVTKRFVWAVMILVFGNFSGNSLAADEAKSLELSRALVQVKLFAGLTDGEREALKSTATLRRGNAGERIIEQGKIQGKMFIVLEGQVKVLVSGKHVATLSDQPLVGEIEFLDQLPASADVFLLTETVFIELNSAALSDLMERQPRLGYVLMREIARIEGRRLRETNPK